MRILDIKPAANPGGGQVRLIASFDLQLTDDVAFYGMRLCRTPDGRHVTYAPTALGGRRSATFSRSLAEAITAAALQSYTERDTADADQTRRSA